MDDPATAALIRLCKEHGGYAEVAAEAKLNAQSVYQIVAGVKLPSGKPRAPGRLMREKLTAAFPRWLDLGISTDGVISTSGDWIAAAQPVRPPTLPEALEVLGIALAREMAADVRKDLSQALSNLAERKGTERDQRRVLDLLVGDSGKQALTGS